MSEKPRLPLGKRKEIIKTNIAFVIIGSKDRENSIAWMCGVDERTIRRDIKKMEQTGEWDDFLQETVLTLSQIGDVDDTTKFREWMKIYGKRFTEKHEVETKGVYTIQVVFSEDMKSESNKESSDKLSTTPSPDSIS